MRDRVKPLIPWVTVEMLAPDAMTVTTVDGEVRGFAGLPRVLQRLLGKAPALYDGITTAGLIKIIRTAGEQARYTDVEIPTGSGPYKIVARPVIGPRRHVHGVQFWLGPGAIAISPPRLAVGFIWDLEAQLNRLPDTMAQLVATDITDPRPVLSLAELLSTASDFDAHGELFELLYHPRDSERMQFDLTLRDVFGRPRQWRMALRARDDPQLRGASWLAEDITADGVVAKPPTLHEFALRNAHHRTGIHLAAVQVAHSSIAYWLTDPAPWVHWERLADPAEVFHPDDRALLLDPAEHSITVRTLDHDGGYRPTALLLHPYPGSPRGELTIGHFLNPGAPSAAQVSEVLPELLCRSPPAGS